MAAAAATCAISKVPDKTQIVGVLPPVAVLNLVAALPMMKFGAKIWYSLHIILLPNFKASYQGRKYVLTNKKKR